jgi:hypothetical protein
MDVWQLIVFLAAYTALLWLFSHFGGFTAAGNAIRRWSSLRARTRHTGSPG